jgi:hypothetical protein
LLLRHSCSIPFAGPVSFRADQEVQIGLLRTYFHYGEFEQNSLDERDLLHPIAVTNFYNSISLVDRQRFYPIESGTRGLPPILVLTCACDLRGRPLGLPETPLRKRCSIGGFR